MIDHELEVAELLVVLATDYVTTYLDEQDWEAGVVAVLARALEAATDRKLKSLEDIWTLAQSSGS